MEHIDNPIFYRECMFRLAFVGQNSE